MPCTCTYIELARWNVWNSRLRNGCNVSFSQNAKILFAQTTYDAHRLLLQCYHSHTSIHTSINLVQFQQNIAKRRT